MSRRSPSHPSRVTDWDPQLLSWIMVSVLACTLVTVLALSYFSLADGPIGWVLAALAAVIGVVGPVAVYRFRTARRRQPPTWQLPPHLSAPVARASERAERLHRLAERTPDGPVADHFRHLATVADTYVVALHDAAAAAAANHDAQPGRDRLDGFGAALERDPDFERDTARITAELDELVEAAEALRLTQRRYLEHSPLSELTERTDRLRASIESEELPQPDAEPGEHPAE